MKREISFIAPIEALQGAQLQFNRKTGTAYRPASHKKMKKEIEYYSLVAVEESLEEKPFFEGGIPLQLSLEFQFPYRDKDFVSRKGWTELRDDPPQWCIGNKDIDNMLKPIKDGMQGIIFANDNQICRYGYIDKKYNYLPSIKIRVVELEP